MTSDDVRFWHKADLLNALTNVRFWGQSGHDLNGPLYRLMTQSGRSNLARLKSGAASSARLLATAEDTLSKGDGAPTKKSPGREKRKVVPGLKCYDWNSQFPAPYFAPRAMRQHPAARRRQYTDRIQAIIFQRSSSVLIMFPKGGIGPTTASEPFRR